MCDLPASRPNTAISGSSVPLLFSAQQGIWTLRVDIDADLTPAGGSKATLNLRPTSPIPVIQVGDLISGATVNSLAIHDALIVPSIAGRVARRGEHEIAYWADTSAGQMIIRGNHLDSDEDGLLDHWERAGGGIDIDNDGKVDLDLAAMGADSLHRDLFLELDWLTDRTSGTPKPWKNEPAPGTLSKLVAMFAAAPALANGIPAGIRLHVDGGPRRDAKGQPFSIDMGTGSLQGGRSRERPGHGLAHRRGLLRYQRLDQHPRARLSLVRGHQGQELRDSRQEGARARLPLRRVRRLLQPRRRSIRY